MIMLRKIFPILFFLCIQAVYARDVNITGKEAGAFVTGGFNRSFYGYGEMGLTGALELNNRYNLNGGFLLGITGYHVEIKLFTGVHITPWIRIPLYFSLAYMYDDLPKYSSRSNTLLPFVSYNGKWAGVSVGTSFRFSSFFRERALFEPLLSMSVYGNFVNNEKLRIGLATANFNDFDAGNMGSYSISLNSVIHINEQWSIINELEVIQSGSIAFSANFYGIAWKTGAKFVW